MQWVPLGLKLAGELHCSTVSEPRGNGLSIRFQNNPCHVPNTLKCKINISTPASLTTEHELVVDTGSAVSILPHYIYIQYFNDTPLLPAVSQLVTFTRKRISVLGCLQVKVSRGVFTAPVTFYGEGGHLSFRKRSYESLKHLHQR